MSHFQGRNAVVTAELRTMTMGGNAVFNFHTKTIHGGKPVQLCLVHVFFTFHHVFLSSPSVFPEDSGLVKPVLWRNPKSNIKNQAGEKSPYFMTPDWLKASQHKESDLSPAFLVARPPRTPVESCTPGKPCFWRLTVCRTLWAHTAGCRGNGNVTSCLPYHREGVLPQDFFHS